MPNAVTTPPPLPPTVTVELTIAPTLNFAMKQSGVPLVSGVVIRNPTAEPLSGARLVVTLAPDLGEPTTVALPDIAAHAEHEVAALDVRLPPGRLRAIAEAERAQVRWALLRGDVTLASGEQHIEVLAYNEWPGLRGPPALLAAFVLPNHPVVGQILRRVRDRLNATTGDPSLAGYQPGAVTRVMETLAATVAVIQDLGITYATTPASFERIGQKARLPDSVLADGMGNCLDLSLLFAACLEQLGFAPLVVIVKEHALPAVWLIDERFPEGVVYDAARLRTQVALGQLLAFDATVCVQPARPSLANAARAADVVLLRDDEFQCAVDVRVVRLDRFRPLPLRMGAPTEVVFDEPATPAERLLAEAALAPRSMRPRPSPRSSPTRLQRVSVGGRSGCST